MTTFDESWSGKPRVIGALERSDHWYVDESDRCLFFGEYTAGVGFGHSSTNSLISNLKKKPSLRGTPEWPHKERAIREAARTVKASLQASTLASVCFVPMPPSKAKDHPEYDDRMEQVAGLIGANDVRPVLFSDESRDARHQSSNRRDPDELRRLLKINRTLIAPHPDRVVILDDMLTTGCGFMVAQERLRAIWPEAKMIGLFIARRIIPKPELDVEIAF